MLNEIFAQKLRQKMRKRGPNRPNFCMPVAKKYAKKHCHMDLLKLIHGFVKVFILLKFFVKQKQAEVRVRPSSKAWVFSTHEERREKIAATDTCVILSIFPAVLSS